MAMAKELSFSTSTKGKDVAILDNYMYNLNRSNGGTRYFECTHRRKGCPARLVVYEDGKFVEKNMHGNHIVFREKVQKQKLMADAKKLATSACQFGT